MSERTLYRKYRPASFAEVRGQEHVVETLRQAIANGRIAHAYLFAGSRGIGKTTLARIFAREIGTKDRDLIEIDAASNRGIDDIRALREEVHNLPFESPYKVYVIDEVHMLTKDAFNALLKTLEEPPAHVVFILATTEQHKLPETIVSRCQAFTLKRPGTAIIKEMVLMVAKAEGYALEPAGAELIALLADGAFRDAHTILEQAIGAAQGTTLTAGDIERITGAPASTLLLTMLDALAARDTDTALRTIHTFVAEGRDMRTTLALLTRLLRSVLLVRTAPSLVPELQSEHTDTEWRAIEHHAKGSVATINSKLLTLLLDAELRTGTTYLPELPLELACIEHGAAASPREPVRTTATP